MQANCLHFSAGLTQEPKPCRQAIWTLGTIQPVLHGPGIQPVTGTPILALPHRYILAAEFRYRVVALVSGSVCTAAVAGDDFLALHRERCQAQLPGVSAAL